MNLYEDQFSEAHDYPKVDKPTKILVIASTGRSGSHMLGHALYESNCFGFPLEYVNPNNLAEWKQRLGEQDLATVLSKIQSRRTSENGVFGIKIHYSHIKFFGGFANLMKMLPDAHYVLLTRKNVLKQAVSLSIAFHTGVWIAGQKPKNDNPQYEFEHINKCLRQIILDNASWRYSLAANGCHFTEMDFDRVRNNLAQSIKDIADFIDIDIDPQSIPQEQVTKIQSKRTNDEWAERFVTDFEKSSELITEQTIGVFDKMKNKIKGLKRS